MGHQKTAKRGQSQAPTPLGRPKADKNRTATVIIRRSVCVAAGPCQFLEEQSSSMVSQVLCWSESSTNHRVMVKQRLRHACRSLPGLVRRLKIDRASGTCAFIASGLPFTVRSTSSVGGKANLEATKCSCLWSFVPCIPKTCSPSLGFPASRFKACAARAETRKEAV